MSTTIWIREQLDGTWQVVAHDNNGVVVGVEPGRDTGTRDEATEILESWLDASWDDYTRGDDEPSVWSEKE